MSIQTRSQLQASAATITTETAAGANTAARVGGLFDDLADTATLNRERGYVSLFINEEKTFQTQEEQIIKMGVATESGIISTYNFSANKNDCTLTFTGAVGVAVRVSANLTFAGGNNRDFDFYIAKNGTPITQSKSSLTLLHNNGHEVFVEAYLEAATNDAFNIYVNCKTTNQEITIQSLNFTAVTL